MPVGHRSYHDPCGVARALDVVGERWALLVVRELLLGPKRFTDLHTGLTSISQNVLSQRLRHLEDSGIVRRIRLGPPSRTPAYELTPRGDALEPILLELGRWGREVPLSGGAELSTDALVLALRTTFAPADSPYGRFGLRIGDDELVAEVTDGGLSVRRGRDPSVPVLVSGEVAVVRAVAFGRCGFREAVAAGDLTVVGDVDRAESFLASFGAR